MRKKSKKDFEDQDFWFADPKMTFTLKDPTPTLEKDIYTWAATTTLTFGSFIVYEGIAVDVPSSEGKAVQEGEFKARHNNGRWLLIDFPTSTTLESGFGSVDSLSA